MVSLWYLGDKEETGIRRVAEGVLEQGSAVHAGHADEPDKVLPLRDLFALPVQVRHLGSGSGGLESRDGKVLPNGTGSLVYLLRRCKEGDWAGWICQWALLWWALA